MQCVRCGGRDLRVFASGGEAARCQFRAVAGVDDVVRDAGVVWVRAVKELEDGERLFLAGVGPVGRRGVSEQSERVEDLRLVIVWVVVCEGCHGALVVLVAG